MLKKLFIVVVILAVVAAAVFWFVTEPRGMAEAALPDHSPDIANGEYMFWAGGCESCHATADATGEALLKLGGGQALDTEFGVFHVPNISPDDDTGIGTWTTLDFVNAMKFGTGKGGEHLYPAFPYTSYQHMKLTDIIDMKAFIDTLEPVSNQVPENELNFPFSIRRGLGLWQLLYVDGQTFEPDPGASDQINRGAYLVTGPGHCGECHTPRNEIGGLIADRALSGAPDPEGKGFVPNITPDDQTGIGSWTESDLVTLFKTGFTPDFDSVGGTMAAVQRNMAKLTDDDLEAIAAYLKSIPPIASEKEEGS